MAIWATTHFPMISRIHLSKTEFALPCLTFSLLVQTEQTNATQHGRSQQNGCRRGQGVGEENKQIAGEAEGP